jgi:hypothetical protein
MIRDAKGHKWFMRFKQYREGWRWDAHSECGGGCIDSGWQLFPTKAAAEADARRYIQSCDHVAYAKEFTRLLILRGTECRLTPEDHEAIRRAATAT